MKKPLAFVAGIIFFSSIAHGFSGIFEPQNTPNLEILNNLNSFIIPGNGQLSSTVLILKTKKGVVPQDIKNFCPHTYSRLYENQASNAFDLYVVDISFPSGGCDKNTIQIETNDESTKFVPVSLSFFDSTKDYEQLLDNSNVDLNQMIQNNKARISELTKKIQELKEKNLVIAKLQIIQYAYEKQFLEFRDSTISTILDGRKNLRYLIPIANESLPTKVDIVPNAGRPYRADTTDGIHHGWDLMAPIGTPVRATSDGVIVRILDDFDWSKFDQIKKGSGLSPREKAENLDIFRGNQVWLKMLDGNVVFYSHLSEIRPELYVGEKIKAGEDLGKVGITGVPDKNYKNSHLHFEIAVNPLRPTDNPADVESMLMWAYLGKGLNTKALFSLQRKQFHSELFARGS